MLGCLIIPHLLGGWVSSPSRLCGLSVVHPRAYPSEVMASEPAPFDLFGGLWPTDQHLWHPAAAEQDQDPAGNDDLTGLLAELNITLGEQPAFGDTAALSPGVGKASPKPPHPPEVKAALPRAPGPAERGSLSAPANPPPVTPEASVVTLPRAPAFKGSPSAPAKPPQATPAADAPPAEAIHSHLAPRVLEILKARAMPQKELAKHINISPIYLSWWLHGSVHSRAASNAPTCVLG